MNNAKPLFDSTTHYRIEVQGLVDIDWLKSFDSSAEIFVDAARQMEEITVLKVPPINRGSLDWCARCTVWE